MRPYLVGFLALALAGCSSERAFAPPVTAVAEPRPSEIISLGGFDGVLIIDGVRYEEAGAQARVLAALGPDDILSVEVAKGQLAARHGVSNGRGVIFVTLKR
jgi:hypothetical protein